MINIFNLQTELEFFQDLAKQKITEKKYRDIVIISQIFPQFLETFESFEDFIRMDKDSTTDIR